MKMGLRGRLETRDVILLHLKLRAECPFILLGADYRQLTSTNQYTEEIHMRNSWHFY